MAFLKIKKSDGSWGLVGGDPLELDETLVKSGYAADALAVGNSIAQLKTSTVLHSEPQNLTEEQKTQALTNLGVYAQDDEPADAEVGTLWIDTDDEGGEGGSGASIALDTTLTQEGMAADAKAVGDAIDNIQKVPIPTIEDSGKFLRVDVSGAYVLEAISVAEGVSF